MRSASAAMMISAFSGRIATGRLKTRCARCGKLNDIAASGLLGGGRVRVRPMRRGIDDRGRRRERQALPTPRQLAGTLVRQVAPALAGIGAHLLDLPARRDV